MNLGVFRLHRRASGLALKSNTGGNGTNIANVNFKQSIRVVQKYFKQAEKQGIFNTVKAAKQEQ
ncbi:hypothetical protein [Atlantibacter sp.]|uniref:hypothetical protein n=1 Tax=Atlantibacter sp. TaxID=1903473 RepID=UPI0028AE2E58|nr:hypothetical protein [Atlantibacter sp.]